MLKPMQLLVPILVGALALPALCQTPPAGPPRTAERTPKPSIPVPYDARYVLFFTFVTGMERRAKSYYAADDPVQGDYFRYMVKREARLTAREIEILKAVAEDCLEQIDTLDKEWRASSLYPQRPTENPNPITRAVLDHINQLRIAFGPKRFPILERYVLFVTRSAVGADVRSRN